METSHLSHSEALVNEDGCGTGLHSAWVLDGASGVVRRQRRRGERVESDVSWFVQRVSQALAALPPDAPLAESLRPALRDIEAQLRLAWRIAPVSEERPSASLVHVRLRGTVAELTNLGDCCLLYRVDGGPVQRFGSTPLATLEQALLQRLAALRRHDPLRPASELAMRLMPVVREMRRQMNQPGGYPILDPSGEGLADTQQAQVSFQHRFEALLMSDGLYRLVDVFASRDDASLFEQAAQPGGLSALLDELRGIERADCECSRWPRMKVHDDATGLWLAASAPTGRRWAEPTQLTRQAVPSWG